MMKLLLDYQYVTFDALPDESAQLLMQFLPQPESTDS
jgi:hypothetical protein